MAELLDPVMLWYLECALINYPSNGWNRHFLTLTCKGWYHLITCGTATVMNHMDSNHIWQYKSNKWIQLTLGGGGRQYGGHINNIHIVCINDLDVFLFINLPFGLLVSCSLSFRFIIIIFSQPAVHIAGCLCYRLPHPAPPPLQYVLSREPLYSIRFTDNLSLK